MKTSTESPQHLTALERANQLRFAHSRILRDLSNNRISLESLFEHEEATGLKFERILSALPGKVVKVRDGEISHSIGTATKIARGAGIAITREWGTLRCERTRQRLLASAYDLAGQAAWIYQDDAPPKLRERRPAKAPDAKTLANRQAALDKGNAVRSRRKEIKEMLRSGEMTLREALDDPASANWPIGKIVVQASRIDPVTGEAIGNRSSAATHMTLRRLKIPPTVPVRALTEQGKAVLLEAMEKTLTLGQQSKRSKVPA